MGLEAMDMDRISDLPQPILYHILSSLSQNEAVKTCVLSKPWRYLWYGRPNLEFCKDHFKGGTQEFISVLDNILIRYSNQNLSIQKLSLKMPVTKFTSVSAPLLEKWIPNKLLLGVETFQFHLSSNYTYFDLPSVLFESKSLRKLYLKRCKLNQINCVLFKHLQTLSLTKVHIEKETFERIMSGCPLIQELSLRKCEGLKTIKLNNRNCSLRNFEFQGCGCWMNVRIEISNSSTIETINLAFCQGYWFDHNRNNVFARLKSLHLSYLHMTTKSLDIFSRNFPCLEELNLSLCYGFEEFQISSCSIKRLSIEVGERIKVSIDAPNISKFEYQGDYIPSHITFTTTSNKWKSNIVLLTKLDSGVMDIPLWLHELDELLMALSRCDQTSLFIRVLRYEDDFRPLSDVMYQVHEVLKHLKLCVGSLCYDYSLRLEEEGCPTQKWNS